MDYRKIYVQLLTKAKTENRKKNLGIYYEQHHIFPKSLYPQYIKNKHNLVLLTSREHFIAHLLCYKIWPCKEMACAMWAFLSLNSYNRTNKVNSRTYENIRNTVHGMCFDEERRNLLSKTSKLMWEQRTVVERKNIGEKIKLALNKSETKIQKSISMKNRLKDENYYNKCCETLSKNREQNKNNPEWIEKIRQTNLKTWSDSKLLEKQRILCREKYKELRENGWNPWKNRYKPIRCINNGMVFNTIEEAKKWANGASKIVLVLHGKRKTAGKHPDTGEKLKWEYVNKN